MSEIIKIDKYVHELEHGTIVTYAVKGKTKYRMPQSYSDLYDDRHLAIMERTVNQPELFDLPEEYATHYIPLATE